MVVSSPMSESLRSHLQSISAHAKSMVAIAASRGVHGGPQGQRMALSSTFGELPAPDLVSLRIHLQQATLPARIIKDVVASYQRACLRLKIQLEEAFDAITPSITSQNLHLLASLRSRLYAQQLTRWLGQVLEVPQKWKAEMEKQRAHITATMGPAKQPRPKFHSEYTPLLELYFRFNAYPTYADRRILAQKTGMLTRQITVWFQNHRRRAKGPLPRMTPTAKIPLEEFERELENMARKMMPVLLTPDLRRLGLANVKAHPTERANGKKAAAKSSKQDQKQVAPQVSRRSAKASKRAEPGPSELRLPVQPASSSAAPCTKVKRSKKSKQSASVSQDVEMTDAPTTTKVKRRKMKKLPRQVSSGTPMDVDEHRAEKTGSSAYDTKAELAFAQAAYPTPSKYAWVHSRKPIGCKQQSPSNIPVQDASRLGKGKPSSLSPVPTVPSFRRSSRLNAMRPPYAFPARYDPMVVPMTFASAQTTRFSFVTDSSSFGFQARTPTRKNDAQVSRAAVDKLVHQFEALRVLCPATEPAPHKLSLSSIESKKLASLRVEGLTDVAASDLHLAPDSYAARRAITYVPPPAPLDSFVSDPPRALLQRQIQPMVLAEPIVQPDAFAPFFALRRAQRKARKERKRKEAKEKKRQEEKDAKKERKKAGLPYRAPSMLDARGLLLRASSVASDISASSQTSSKKSKKTTKKSTEKSSPSARASSVSSSGRTPSLASTSSRRSSGISMPSTPQADENLPIIAGSDFVLGGHDDVPMTPDLMSQLFGESIEDVSGCDEPMQYDEFSPDMLTFSSCNGGPLGDMTVDVNMPGLSDLNPKDLTFDDMNWTSIDYGTQSAASFDTSHDVANIDLNWLLGQGASTAPDWSALTSTTPSITSQINVLGNTYPCELGGTSNTNAPLNLADLSFGFSAGENCLTSFDTNFLGGTMLAV